LTIPKNDEGAGRKFSKVPSKKKGDYLRCTRAPKKKGGQKSKKATKGRVVSRVGEKNQTVDLGKGMLGLLSNAQEKVSSAKGGSKGIVIPMAGDCQTDLKREGRRPARKPSTR